MLKHSMLLSWLKTCKPYTIQHNTLSRSVKIQPKLNYQTFRSIGKIVLLMFWSLSPMLIKSPRKPNKIFKLIYQPLSFNYKLFWPLLARPPLTALSPPWTFKFKVSETNNNACKLFHKWKQPPNKLEKMLKHSILLL